MEIIQSLTELGLKQLMGDGAGVVLGLARERFTDQGKRALEALNNANKRAWQTLEIALAGASWWDQVKARREDLAFARELQAFVNATPLAELAAHPQSREQCRSELRQARQRGIIPGRLSAEDLPRHADAKAVLDVEAATLAGVAQELKRRNYVWLAWLIQQRPHGGPPLLALAVRYFFRREVEADAELFRGLAFQEMAGLSQDQARAFHGLDAALAKHGRRVEELLGGVLEVVQDTHACVKRLEKQFQKVLDQLQMRGRELSPRDSMCIRNEGERQLVMGLLEQVRQVPEAELQSSSRLLIDAGKAQVAVGDYKGARETFGRAAISARDDAARGEAYYNAYRAALEQRDWDDALKQLIEAIRIDGKRFAPFPVGRYTPQRILGAGGFGVAFLCQHKHLQVPLVVKALLMDDLAREAENVFSEVQVLTQLDDPAFVRAFDCGYSDSSKKSRPYLVMDYFEGVALSEHVRQKGPLPLADLKPVARAVAQGLEAAHAKGILHRDVKPANLLLRQESSGWRVKLIDFGLALKRNLLEDKVRNPGAWDNRLAGNTIAGTLEYGAPEQIGAMEGVAIGPHSDVYSFGKTCYFALMGTPDPDHKQKAVLPRGWRKFLEDCTANPGNRLPDFKTVLQRLARLKTPKPGGAGGGDKAVGGGAAPVAAGKGRQGAASRAGVLHIHCPYCQRKLVVQEAHVGQVLRCSGCSSTFLARRPPQDELLGKRADLSGGGHAHMIVPQHEAGAEKCAPQARPGARLAVLRGLHREVEYPLREGPNLVGRAGNPPVNVDLGRQEADGRLQPSQRHAVITCEGGAVTIEDLKSANGTYVNRERLPAEQKRPLKENDVIQIGSVQLQLKVGGA